METSKVDYDWFDGEEWMGDVEQVVEALGSRRNRDKRAHFAAALAHAAATDRPEDVERHRFLDLLEDFRPSHLRLLAVVASAERFGPAGGVIDDYLRTRLPDQDLENIKLDWSDMQSVGILAGIPSGVATTPFHERVASSLPAIGRRFVAFIEADTQTE